nr:DUF2817 domain-containing protein [Deltaproteobacteria bacterium]
MRRLVRLLTLTQLLIACAADGSAPIYDNQQGTDCSGKCDGADDTGYFLDSYDAARTRFRATAARVAATHPGAELGRYEVPSAIDQDLTTDWVYLPATGTPQRLIIVTSGVHGAEAFVGSAVQEMLMGEWLPAAKLDTTSVLFVHALNPWGYKHRRRVTAAWARRSVSAAAPSCHGCPRGHRR